MEQISVLIGEVDVPVIVDDGVEWFPVTFIFEKVLLRKGKKSLGNVKKYMIDYGMDTGGIQEVNCINAVNLREVLKKTRVGWLSVEQRKAQNTLHEHLGMGLLHVDEQDTNYYDPKWLSELDDYTRDVVQSELESDWFRRCSNCNKPFPLTTRFYCLDSRAEKGYVKVCKVCLGRLEHFNHPDKDKNEVRKQGVELYQSMQGNYLLAIFEAYRKGEIKRLPECYENQDSYGEMILLLFQDGVINEKNLTQTYLQELGLKGVSKYFNIDEIYKFLFGVEFYYYPYKYPKFSYTNGLLTMDMANRIVSNYMKEYNVIIDDIFTYDYEKLFRKSRIAQLTNGKTLEFLVQYYKYQYAGYKFNTKSNNYYKDENNLLFDLKYLIEVDMKLHPDKIPLYLTKNVLQKYCRPLYYWIVSNKNGSIFEWVDKLYPNKFELVDFEINAYRNEFDSDTEAFIHEILKEEFGGNVIYNQRNNTDTVKLKSKVPDWFLFTDYGVWVIEYFGFFDDRHTENNRIKDYKAKTEDKLRVYDSIVGYNFLYLYKIDVDNNFYGLRQKIAEIKEKLYTTRD